MKLALPEGYQMPKTATPGEPFEAVATVLLTPEGGFELVALDGVKLDAAPAPEMEVEMMDEASEIKLPFGEDVE